MSKYVRIRIVSRGSRLRAVAELMDDELSIGYLGEWWIESRDKVRYKPLKPMHPRVLALVSRLPPKKIEELCMFLLTATEGDEYIIPIEEFYKK